MSQETVCTRTSLLLIWQMTLMWISSGGWGCSCPCLVQVALLLFSSTRAKLQSSPNFCLNPSWHHTKSTIFKGGKSEARTLTYCTLIFNVLQTPNIQIPQAVLKQNETHEVQRDWGGYCICLYLALSLKYQQGKSWIKMHTIFGSHTFSHFKA